MEKRHFPGKSALEISPVFLKKNTRIEALLFLGFIAPLVAALIERALRQNMLRRRIQALPILPEGRYAKTPSYAQVLDTCALRGNRAHDDKPMWPCKELTHVIFSYRCDSDHGCQFVLKVLPFGGRRRLQL